MFWRRKKRDYKRVEDLARQSSWLDEFSPSSIPVNQTEFGRVVAAIEEFSPSGQYSEELPYQSELQGWLKTKFPSRIEVQSGASRPDIVIGDIAIEVKGPTDDRALDSLVTKCLKYSGHYSQVVLVLFEPTFSESNFREIESGIKRFFPMVRVIRKDSSSGPPKTPIVPAKP